MNKTFVFFFQISSCQSVQNLGLAIVSMIAGMIVDSGGYFMLEVFFICWLCGKYFESQKKSLVKQISIIIWKFTVALLATVIIWIYNSSKKGILNMSPYERDLHFALMSVLLFIILFFCSNILITFQ